MVTKIVLLNPPGSKRYNRDVFCSGSTKGDYCWPQADLLCFSGIFKEDTTGEYEFTVIDCLAENLSPQDTLNRLDVIGPNYIIFMTGVASWLEDIAFIKQFKEGAPTCKVIASGGITIFVGEKLMKEDNTVDAMCMDFTTTDILDYLNGKEGPIDNIIYRKGTEVIVGKLLAKQNFSYPVPRHNLFPLNKYRLPMIHRYPFTTIMSSMGCVHRCTFCLCSKGLIPYRSRDVENTIEEMKYIESIGIKEVRFGDYSITINKPNIKKLCERMIEEGFTFKWHGLSRVDEVNEELLKLMKNAGCKTLMFGVESGDQGILNRHCKGLTLDKIRKVFQQCHDIGIDTFGTFIIGLPGETRESVQKTIDFMINLDCDYADIQVATPYVGTKLRDEAIEKGWIDSKFKDDLFSDAAQYPIMHSDTMSSEEMWAMKNKAVRAFYFRPSYILKRIFSVRSVDDFKMQFRMALDLLKYSR